MNADVKKKLSELRKWRTKLTADADKIVYSTLTDDSFSDYLVKGDIGDLRARLRLLSKDVEFCIREIEKGMKDNVQDVTKF